ncbi:unnamed protein product [Caenorhabditis auriculariae]|uniref:Uncharacterized protein n=1 Tax=Caenorhabditis auriculariae TaxID=2777116 RepID=A0A8S1HA80_9PELO|nr:unnamed protein product [Caenorhabditis auriculariae]
MNMIYGDLSENEKALQVAATHPRDGHKHEKLEWRAKMMEMIALMRRKGWEKREVVDRRNLRLESSGVFDGAPLFPMAIASSFPQFFFSLHPNFRPRVEMVSIFLESLR